MKVTNNTNLGDAIFRAIADDSYSRGEADISVTGLLDPPRKATLETELSHLLMEDASDLARPFIGKAVHWYIWWSAISALVMILFDALRRWDVAAVREAWSRIASALSNLNDNRRLFMEVNGWTISGQTDNYLDGVVADYKTPSVNEWKFGLKKEREQQLNCYAELLRVNGFEVTALKACLIFVDYSPRRAIYEKNYPPASIVEVDVPLWPSGVARAFIEERVALHQKARTELPLCTDEERWGESKWAVTAEGLTRAFRVVDSEEEAGKIADEKGSNYYVEERIGEPIRCANYCSVSFACQQYQGEVDN